MKKKLLNSLSNLTFLGFYDPSKKIVTVHFYNDTEDKSDLIAYLNHDMSWDIRKIISEESVLFSDKEVITLSHELISTEKPEGGFDDFIRLGLIKMGLEVHGKDANLPELDVMFRILEDNKYE